LGHKYGLAFGQDADKSKKSNVYSTFSSVCSKGFSITMSRSREHLLFAGRFLRQLYSNCQRICIQNHNGWPGNDTSMFVIILSEECSNDFCVTTDIENVTNFCDFCKALMAQGLWKGDFTEFGDNGF